MNAADDDAALTARVLETLAKWNQCHVLDLLTPPSESQSLLLAQLVHFEHWYRGGLDAYLRNATQLFHAQQSGTTAPAGTDAATQDPYADWIPSVPRGAKANNDANKSMPLAVAHLNSPEYRELEAIGLRNIDKSAFMVVAGGLGERLGYHDIKLKLPVETLTSKSYIEAYIQHLLALQTLACEVHPNTSIRIPLAIMTSDVTHDETWRFLVANDFFGMQSDQITLLKQEKVPCLDAKSDNKGALQLTLERTTTSNEWQLQMKPHGHGDVHTLLHSSGLATQWLAQGKQYVHFFQDTNYLILNSMLPMLGASIQNQWAFNFTSVQRKAKDASGGVVRFTKPHSHGNDDEEEVAALFNVEYHELDHFLRTKASAAFPDGDTNDPATGFSPFPGNINHFVIELQSYVVILEVSKGFVPELFNPKYRDEVTKQAFKSPARLECMMQDYPKLLVEFRDLLGKSESHSVQQQQNRIGLVLFPPSLVYSPCKNDVVSAKSKAQQDIPPQCAGSAEHDLLAVNRVKFASLGITFTKAENPTPSRSEWLGIPLDCTGPQIVMSSRFAPSHSILESRFQSPAQISITQRSTLIVDGSAITFHRLTLDGALRVVACDGATVEIKTLRVQNAGCKYEPVEITESTDPIDAMRGYRFVKSEVRELVFDVPGHYVIEE
ncbi:Udp-sugar pyrophospharylase, partial [Globisporangium splendens]